MTTIKNASKGYGYNYASLADFDRQGVKIPKMRTTVSEFGEYVEYFDDNEWQRGAKVVTMDMKGMNAAQAYGSALTYARRYTVALANGIATDDDDNVEKAKPTYSKPEEPRQTTSNEPATPQQRAALHAILKDSFEEVETKLGGFTKKNASEVIAESKRRKEQDETAS